MKVDSYRKRCRKQQTELRRILMSFSQHRKAIKLFLSQHAMLHSAKMAQIESWPITRGEHGMRSGHLDRPSILSTPIVSWMYYYEV